MLWFTRSVVFDINSVLEHKTTTKSPWPDPMFQVLILWQPPENESGCFTKKSK